eukprot:TRINITY_DN2475_c0_g2_i1.p1 TRINITY_DN2475_c0_g2~~TRINITY_DN2475_c0_g2_i1.p1  ORF type:complete len:297 (+),score=29.00 TRINITY_DN2475_c0_g2_i1:3-893(+)
MTFNIALCFSVVIVLTNKVNPQTVNAEVLQEVSEWEEGWFCDQDLTVDYFLKYWRQGAQPNASRIAPIISTAKELWSVRLEGMSMSQIIDELPQASSEVLGALWLLFPNQSDIIQFASPKGLLQIENGTEILSELRRPQVLAEALSLGFQWFNWSCYSDYDFALVANILIYVEPLLSEEYRDELADFLVGFTVEMVNIQKAKTRVKEVLSTIISTLKKKSDAQGNLSTFRTQASSEVVANVFEEAIRDTRIETNSQNWGKLMMLLFKLLKTLLDFDDVNFINFIRQRIQDIIEQLQ